MAIGTWFGEHERASAALWRVKRDGSAAEQSTYGSLHSGFPSYSADGKHIVFRAWAAAEKGLRTLDFMNADGCGNRKSLLVFGSNINCAPTPKLAPARMRVSQNSN
ncbi:MAG: hypothetical protein V4857_24085 [Pseudomonadota bacterium]